MYMTRYGLDGYFVEVIADLDELKGSHDDPSG